MEDIEGLPPLRKQQWLGQVYAGSDYGVDVWKDCVAYVVEESKVNDYEVGICVIYEANWSYAFVGGTVRTGVDGMYRKNESGVSDETVRTDVDDMCQKNESGVSDESVCDAQKEWDSGRAECGHGMVQGVSTPCVHHHRRGDQGRGRSPTRRPRCWLRLWPMKACLGASECLLLLLHQQYEGR